MNAVGLAIADTVLLRRGAWNQSVLFHELVHAEQYRLRGVRGFLKSYLRDAIQTGGYPFGITLETQAYALQERYDAGERFDVSEALRALDGPV